MLLAELIGDWWLPIAQCDSRLLTRMQAFHCAVSRPVDPQPVNRPLPGRAQATPSEPSTISQPSAANQPSAVNQQSAVSNQQSHVP
jgi:hypothetical protein